MHFILIDDNPLINLNSELVLKKALSPQGVVCFQGGQAALDYLTQQLADHPTDVAVVVLLDINMPEMDGWQFLEAYSQLPPTLHQRIAIHMLSSSIHQADIQRARQNPFVRSFICKPLDYQTVRDLFG